MCDPVTITGLVVGGMAAGGGITDSVNKHKAAKSAKNQAKNAYRQARVDVGSRLQDEAEAAANDQFELARARLEQQGEIRASGASQNSVRALSRLVGFEIGQEQAAVNRNFEEAEVAARQGLVAANKARDAAYIAAGDTSGVALGMNIAGSVVGGAMQGLSAASMMSSLPAPSTPAPGPLGPNPIAMNTSPGAPLPGYAGLGIG